MEDIRFCCRVCGQKLAIDSAAAGWEIRCPQCGTPQTAPTSAELAAASGPSSGDGREPQPAIPGVVSPEPAGGAEFQYDAFISYRHVEPDRTLAKWLHTALETYRVPKQLAKERGLPPRLRKLFRDEDELPASADLSREIQQALRRSRFLIVICSLRTPSSQWVNAEVAAFRELGRHDQILALLIEGEPGESFPQALREIRRTTVAPTGDVRQTIEEVEPLAADVRPGRKEGQRYVRQVAKLRLLASLLGVPFDHLRQRERERERSRRLRLGALLAGVGLCFLAITAAYFSQREQVKGAEKMRGEKLVLSRAKAEMAAQASRPPPFEEAKPIWLEAADQALAKKIAARRESITNGLPTCAFIETLQRLGAPEVQEAPSDETPMAPSPGTRLPEGVRVYQMRNPLQQPNGRIGPPPRTRSSPDAAPLPELPQKFLLEATLAAVRQVDDRAYVFLTSAAGDPGFAQSRSLSIPMPLEAPTSVWAQDEVATLACVVFEGHDVVPYMADYQIGQPVRVVVERHAWAKGKEAPREATPSISMNFRPRRSWIMDVQNPHWKEFCRLGDTDGLFWCCLGKGIEKPGQPSTWIDPLFGRADRIGNKEDLQRSFGTVLRDPPQAVRARGLMEATFVGLLPLSPAKTWDSLPLHNFGSTRPEDSEPVLAILSVPNTVEGSMTVVATLGTKPRRNEFQDYPRGSKIEAVVTFQSRFEAPERLWPLRDPTMPSDFKLPRSAVLKVAKQRGLKPPSDPYFKLAKDDPLACPLSVKCEWIQVKGKPQTLVSADGPRRPVLADPGGNVTTPQKTKN